MEERHTFKIEIRFSVTCYLDFERCVAAVRKRVFEPVLTAIRRIKRDAPRSLLRGIFSSPSLRWIVERIFKLAVSVALVLVSHGLTTVVNARFGLGLSSECRQSLADVLTYYILQEIK